MSPEFPEDSRERPRVAVVAYTEYPWDPRVRGQAETLLENGYHVHALTLRPKSGSVGTHLEGVHLHELPLQVRRGSKVRYAYQYALFFFLSAVALIRLHRRRPLDLVHVHSLPDFLVFCALPLKVLGVPVLLDLHEALPEILAARFRLRRRSLWCRLAALLEGLSCRIADHVVTANDGIRDAVIRRGVPPEHLTTVYNPGGPLPREEDPEALRVQLGLPRGRLIVHAGGINPERDLETLIRAIARLPADADAQLIIAGDGEPAYLRALRRLTESLGLSERVRFVGRLSRAQAAALMALSEVGIVTLESNPLTELSWPTRIVDYANLRKPLVVPRLRFMQSILEDGARYYAPGDEDSLAQEIGGILRAPEACTPSLAKAEQICGRFEGSRMRGVLLQIYRSVGGSHLG